MKKLGILGICLALMFSFNVKAVSTNQTLADLRKDLAEFQAQKKKNENQKALTQNEIKQKNNDIANAKKEIDASEVKIEDAKKSIEETKGKITEYEAKTEDVMAFYQLMMGENSYLEFVTDSSSMTELIMRVDAVEKLIEYNQQELVTLEDLIKENEQKQIDLKNYEKELNNNITSYESKIKSLNSEYLELSDISVDIESDIKSQKDAIKTYEQMGCKETETLEACIARTSSSTWLKPVPKGRINSLFGRRNGNSNVSSNHSGIDIGVSEGTQVLSSTVGTVVTTFRTNCGGNQVYVQSYIDGKPYVVLYAHLLKVSVKTGQKVDQNTTIGYSGGYSTSTLHGGYDRCTTGAHLHVSVSQTIYKNYSNYVAHLINPPGYPKTKGAWFYSRTQWFD